jgi:hypothetical protein
MSKTIFKRLSLAVVIALGVGVLSTAPSTALTTTRTLAIDAATDTAIRGDSATAVLTHTLAGTSLPESSVIQYTCVSSGAAAGVTCPTVTFWKTAAQMSDTANFVAWTSNLGTAAGYLAFKRDTTWVDSLATTAGVSTINAKIASIPNAGTYAYNFFVLNAEGTLVSSSASWTVTVTAPDNAGATLKSYYFGTDLTTQWEAWSQNRATSDSAPVVAKGSSTPAVVAYGFFKVANAAGDTKTVQGTLVNDSITATITAGPGALSNSATTPTSGTPSVILNVRNGNAVGAMTTTETLSVLSSGVAGTTTIRLTNLAGTTVGTLTVVFTGEPASVSQQWFSDTIVQLSGADPTVTAIVKDAGLSTLKSGTVYIYSSDTKVAGYAPTSYPNFGLTTHAATIASTGLVTFTVPTTDTGTVTLTIRDSWTVAASTWSSDELTLTITGDVVGSFTLSFDKATYSPGERAVLTITAKDAAARLMATGSLASAFNRVVGTPSSLTTVTGGANLGGTNSGVNYDAVTFNGYRDTGVETRVVTMPTYGTDVSVEFRIPTFGSTTEYTTVTATAKVVDPNATAIAAAQAAIAAAQASADAATDAAAEAIDAANAATDASNLAAEAADAATVAAEEARDAADAATAAVEELATQVATLMAALKAQLTTLANTVAKIAKKVKA